MNTGQLPMVPANLRRLRTLHDGLARDFGAALSGLLRTSIDVSVTDVDQLDYGRFMRSLSTPTCFYVLKAEPLKERLMLDVEPAILHPMINRLLGGPVEEEPPPNRPLTEIERSLAARIVRLFLRECRSAWPKTLDLDLDILQVESNPRPSRILPDDEQVIFVEFELIIAEMRGLMRLCLPCRIVEGLVDTLPAENRASRDGFSPGASAVVEVTLAETQISAEALADLRVGDIITTETAADSPATVSIEGAAQFLGKPGTYQGRKAVRLTEPIRRAAQDDDSAQDDDVPEGDGS